MIFYCINCHYEKITLRLHFLSVCSHAAGPGPGYNGTGEDHKYVGRAVAGTGVGSAAKRGLDVVDLVKTRLMSAKNFGDLLQLFTHRREGLGQRGNV